MPAWTGGLCPQCGQDMPAKLLHCQFCRASLNPDLHRSDVNIPQFFELQEISNEVELAGYYIQCPHCEEELRINKKYAGYSVACKCCRGKFLLDLSDPELTTKAFYMGCPHCDEELRVATKYLGMKVACKLCEGHVQIMSGSEQFR